MTEIDWTLADNTTALLPDLRPDPFDFFDSTNEDPEHAPDLSWFWNDQYPLEWQPLGPKSHLHQTAAALLGPSPEDVTPPDPVAQIPSHDGLQEPDFPGVSDGPSLHLEGAVDVQSSGLQLLDLFGAAGMCQFSETDEEQSHVVEDTRRNKRPRTSPVPPIPRPLKRHKAASRLPQQRRAKLPATSKATLEAFYAVNPYPEASDFAELAKQIAIKERRIRVWFNNKRNRTARNNTQHNGDLPAGSSCGPTKETFEEQLANVPKINPKSLLEKYLEVPLEECPRIHGVIQQDRDGKESNGSGSEDVFDYFPRSQSGRSGSSCGSNVSWSSRRGRARSRWTTRQRRREPYNIEYQSQEFHCTFCGKTFKDQYQWKRHEEPTHAPRSGWICKHPECMENSIENRIFFRKDWFKQHYDKHLKRILPGEDTHWEVETIRADPIPEDHPALSCGFCGERLPDWDSRMKHLAAHFDSGANLSQWWLKRAQVTPGKSRISSASWPLELTGKIMRNSVSCADCGRLFLSLSEAELLHPRCTTWSCGRLEGVQAAYSDVSFSPLRLRNTWSCRYCEKEIYEAYPDHSKRLSHLVKKHAYRSCTPPAFRELATFRSHLINAHRAKPFPETYSLEDACQLTRRPRFESAATDYDSPERTRCVELYGSLSMSFRGRVNIISRDECGAVKGTVSTLAMFEPASQVNFIDRKMVEEDIRASVSTNTRPIRHVFEDISGYQTPVVGEVVIQWAGPWRDKRESEVLRFAPIIYKTECCVVDDVPHGLLIIGLDTLKEHGLIEDDSSSASSESSVDAEDILPFESICLDIGESSTL